jgi:hypothetical protein
MPSSVAPRLLTRANLRAYLRDLTWREIEARMLRGQIPGPLWGLATDDPHARWDRRAVDRALDAASGIPASVEAEEAALDRALGIA